MHGGPGEGVVALALVVDAVIGEGGLGQEGGSDKLPAGSNNGRREGSSVGSRLDQKGPKVAIIRLSLYANAGSLGVNA